MSSCRKKLKIDGKWMKFRPQLSLVSFSWKRLQYSDLAFARLASSAVSSVFASGKLASHLDDDVDVCLSLHLESELLFYHSTLLFLSVFAVIVRWRRKEKYWRNRREGGYPLMPLMPLMPVSLSILFLLVAGSCEEEAKTNIIIFGIIIFIIRFLTSSFLNGCFRLSFQGSKGRKKGRVENAVSNIRTFVTCCVLTSEDIPPSEIYRPGIWQTILLFPPPDLAAFDFLL